MAVLNIPPDAETASVVVNITNHTEEAFSLSAPESNNRAFAAELKTIEPGKGYFVRIDYPPNASYKISASPVLVAAELGRMEIEKLRPLDARYIQAATCGNP